MTYGTTETVASAASMPLRRASGSKIKTTTMLSGLFAAQPTTAGSISATTVAAEHRRRVLWVYPGVPVSTTFLFYLAFTLSIDRQRSPHIDSFDDRDFDEDSDA